MLPEVGKITVGLRDCSKAEFSPPFSCAVWTGKKGFIRVLKQLRFSSMHRSCIHLT